MTEQTKNTEEKETLARRLALAVLPPLVAGLMRVWFGSCRLKEHGADAFYSRLARGERIISTFWHYGIFYLFYYMRGRQAAAMVSASRDGEYIARLAALLGHLPIRGSSHRRGFRALREMLNALAKGYNGAIVADGSQGPPRKAQAGCVLMASRSGCPICPMVWAASSVFIFHSWDRLALPRPFSRIVLRHGKPLFVPPDLDAAGIEAWRQKLEDELNELYDACWRDVGRGPHDADLAH